MTRTAFTLIEVLLALALAAMVTGLAGRIVVISAQTSVVVQRQALVLDHVAMIFEQLRSDMGGLMPDPLGDEGAVELFGHEHPTLQLRVLAVVSTAPGAMHTPRLPGLVRYRVEMEESGLRLVRESLPAVHENEAMARRTIAAGLEEIRYELLVGQDWKTRHAAKDGKDKEPIRALRLSCRWRGQQAVHQRTFVLPRSEWPHEADSQ